jgi:gluconokinase
MEYVIGLDIGTTHCKSVALAMDGQVLQQLQSGYPSIQTVGGQSEQEVELIFSTVLQLLQKTFSNLRQQHKLKAIAFSSAMHSIIAVDGAGVALTNAYTWADTRSDAFAKQLIETGVHKELYPLTGVPVHPMLPLCKIIWMRQTMPTIFALAKKFISIKEYIFFRLFGKYIVDFSIASATGLFNIHQLTWEDKALKLAGITAANLSKPVPVRHIETELKREYKSFFQFGVPVPFVIGGSDGCFANIGSGAFEKGEAALTIGTSGAIRMVAAEPTPDPRERLFNYVVEKDFVVTGGPVNNGGIALKWFAENFLQSPFESGFDFQWFLGEADKVEPGAGGLIFLPYLLGERAPHWNQDIRAVFFGLDLNHRREHLMRAVIEGISFGLYEVMLAVEEVNGRIDRIYATGGFIQSKFWLQLLADMFDRKIVVSAMADASAVGAALVGMYATDVVKDLRQLRPLLKTAEAYEPDAAKHLAYEKYFRIFRSLYPKLKENFSQLAALKESNSVLP